MAASLPTYDLIPLPGEGPEDVVVGSDGSIYTGLLDGRILAVAPKDGAVREVAKTGGRPLGLEATTDGRLLICDSPKGLLELDLKTGVLKTLVTHDGAEPLIFCSNVVAAPDGDLFFTISSMRYTVHEWRKDIVENVPTGRVYRRVADGTLTRLMDGLCFANGLVRSRDGKSLIVAETAGRRLLRLWLAGDRAGTSEVIAELPGFPDNLCADEDGMIWVAFASEPNPMLENLYKLPFFPVGGPRVDAERRATCTGFPALGSVPTRRRPRQRRPHRRRGCQESREAPRAPRLLLRGRLRATGE